jgi:phospholipase/carboxylesterase
MPKQKQKLDASSDPHADQPILSAGAPVAEAELILILLHGRGATADSILQLYDALELETVAALAPDAAGNSWYPNSFLAPLESNQPSLDSALARVEAIVAELIEGGMPSQRIALLGFSQGACLTTEFIARHPRHYAGAIALTGGLIGPPGTPRNYTGSLSATSVFLGAGDPDPHVPFSRVQETHDVLTKMGATSEIRRFPGLGHTINDNELDASRRLLQRAITAYRRG